MKSKTGTREYELELKRDIGEYFHKLSYKIKEPCKIEVKNQWNPFQDETKARKYSPRIDIAVGPFAYGSEQYGEVYNELSKASNQLINSLLKQFKENVSLSSFNINIPNDYKLNEINKNARCFLAIEIERTGSRKDRLGDIVNACSLGRIGIIIAWDNRVLKSFLAITAYLQFLKAKEKETYKPKNLIIVTKEQFSDILNQQLKLI